jgi:spermidine synthase
LKRSDSPEQAGTRTGSDSAPSLAQPVAVLFALFAISGFTGLVYESLWSHYLKLFLGHAAFAQSFVLAVFMGGMAIGAWVAARSSARLTNLLAAYGWIEAAIGLIALVFHEVFVVLTEASLVHVIPRLGDPGAVEAFKLTLSLGLLLPQSILLGMTFPLMSGAVLRRNPGRSGHHLAMLYFTNSIGAAAGALVAAFVLLAWLGTQGTMRLAGAINLALAMAVLLLSRKREYLLLSQAPAAAGAENVMPLFLTAAFVTGAASFVYEITWIRMLSLVLGASFQAFELMLSAFVTGLALGGLWIRKRIDRVADPVRFSGYVQLAMGLAALATVLMYHSTFDWMRWLMGSLQRNADGYVIFNLGSHAIAFAIMIPATFLAGMTLPLFTYCALRSGAGERAIGQVYAANTLGAIAGVLLAVHVLLPGAGLKLSLVAGALLDMLLGAWLLRASLHRFSRWEALAGGVLGAVAAALVMRGAALDPGRLSSGVFRHGFVDEQGVKVPFYVDGKTASVALRQSQGGLLSLTSNGKIDASIELDETKPRSPDETTMVLTAALPLVANPAARSFGVIGMGAGLTSETLLSHSRPESVDTIEIEPAMVEAARGFYPRVQRPFNDPRSHIYAEDARTFFARHGKRYDVIISEPSNPWVNGVASLFTREFYRDVKRHLASHGLFAQWIQTYELDDRLLGSVLEALGEHFEDYAVFETTSVDYLVLAVAEGNVPRLARIAASESGFREQLRKIGLTGGADLELRLLGTRRSVSPLLQLLKVSPNSDFRPTLQIGATRARFVLSGATALFSVANAPLPILEMLYGERSYIEEPRASAKGLLIAAQNDALAIHRALLDPHASPLAMEEPEARLPLASLQSGRRALCAPHVSPEMLEQLDWLAAHTLAYLARKQRFEMWVEPRWIGCDPARIAPEARVRLALYRAIATRDARAMHRRGRALLDADATGAREWRRFALLAAMLGAHASGQSDEARALWRQRAPGLFTAFDSPAYVAYISRWTPESGEQQ